MNADSRWHRSSPLLSVFDLEQPCRRVHPRPFQCALREVVVVPAARDWAETVAAALLDQEGDRRGRDALLAEAHQLNFSGDDILRMLRERKAAMDSAEPGTKVGAAYVSHVTIEPLDYRPPADGPADPEWNE